MILFKERLLAMIDTIIIAMMGIIVIGVFATSLMLTLKLLKILAVFLNL